MHDFQSLIVSTVEFRGPHPLRPKRRETCPWPTRTLLAWALVSTLLAANAGCRSAVLGTASQKPAHRTAQVLPEPGQTSSSPPAHQAVSYHGVFVRVGSGGADQSNQVSLLPTEDPGATTDDPGVPAEDFPAEDPGVTDAANLSLVPPYLQLPNTARTALERTVCLLPSDCQCRAAAESVLANLLDRESQVVQCVACKSRRVDNGASQFRRRILHYRAVEERNRAAGTALKLYYGLAETDRQAQVLRDAFVELERNTERLARLREADLPPPRDTRQIERQRIEFLQRHEELGLQNFELQQQLKYLINQPECSGNIVPETRLTPDPSFLLEPEAAVAIGIPHRADLALLRMLCCCVDQDNLSDASSALGRADGLLGSPLSPSQHLSRIFERRTADCQLPARRQQLCHLADERQRTVAAEIRAAAVKLETRLRQVALGRDLLADWDRQLSDLRDRREADQLVAPDSDTTQTAVSVFDISQAILQRMEAESDLIHRVIAWQLAVVELQQAQGLLAFECGYALPCGCR